MARNVIVDKLIKQIDKLQKRLNILQDQCIHIEYEIIDNYNDHDGYSIVPVTWYQTRKCRDCNKIYTVKTSTKDHR